MARPRVHLVASSLIAFVLHRRTRHWSSAIAALTGGFLIDADHLVDRFLHRRLPRHFDERIVLPLHGWELAPLFAAIERRLDKRTGGGFTLGYVAHLVVDQLTNHVQHPGTYSLLFRAARGFRHDLFGDEDGPSAHHWRDEKSLVGLLRWF